MNRWPLWTPRLMPVMLAAAGSIGVGWPQTPSAPPAPAVSSERAVINKYCVGCHNDKLKASGLALDTSSVERADQNPQGWEKVMRKIRGRYMPPAGLPRPD